jgi:hypothetical protein
MPWTQPFRNITLAKRLTEAATAGTKATTKFIRAERARPRGMK